MSVIGMPPIRKPFFCPVCPKDHHDHGDHSDHDAHLDHDDHLDHKARGSNTIQVEHMYTLEPCTRQIAMNYFREIVDSSLLVDGWIISSYQVWSNLKG